MISICKHKRNLNTLSGKTHAEIIRELKVKFVIALSLAVVLGLGWGVGLVATSSNIPELTFTLQIIFGVFVGSQGVLIFFLHGVRSEDFRSFWTKLVPWIQKRQTMSTMSSVQGHTKMYRSKDQNGPDSTTTSNGNGPTIKKGIKSASIAVSDCSSIPEKGKRKSTTGTVISDSSSIVQSPRDSVFETGTEAYLLPVRKSSAGGNGATVIGIPPHNEEVNGMVIVNIATTANECYQTVDTRESSTL